jgi:hypothetical protein
LYFFYWEKLKTKTLSTILVGFLIYAATYIFALPVFLVSYMLLALSGAGEGAGFLLVFGLPAGIILGPVGFLIQLFIAHFVAEKKRPEAIT